MRGLVFYGFVLGLAAAPAQALDCAQVEAVGDPMGKAIAQTATGWAAEQVKKMPVNKTVTINSVISVYFDGCTMTALSQITVRRKNRATRYGIATMAGPVTKLTDTEICVGRLKYTRADIMQDANVGADGYDWVAQTSIPAGTCFPR